MSSESGLEFNQIECQEFCAKVADGTHESPLQTEFGKRLATSKNIKDGRLNLENAYLISQEDFDDINRRSKVDQWDILISMIGTVGEVCLVDSHSPDFAIKNVGLLKCRDKIHAKWLYYFFRSSAGRQLVEERKKGTTQQYISLGEIRRLPIPVPSESAYMKAATDTLSALDDRIALLRETNATLEAIAQAIFKSWFVDFDPVHAKQQGRAPEGMSEATAAPFPDSFEESELGMVPRGWKVGTLADMVVYQNGYAFKTQDWQNTGYPVVKIGNVKPGIIDIAGTSCVSSGTVIGLERFLLKRGDLLVGMTGYVGETGLMPDIDPPAYLNQRVGRISTSSGIVDLGFVYCIVRNAAYKTYAEAKSHGSAQANVSGTELMSYPTVLPSSDVLETFNQITHRLIDKILANHAKAQTLATLRDTLLPRLISGQLRLPDVKIDKVKIEEVA